MRTGEIGGILAMANIGKRGNLSACINHLRVVARQVPGPFPIIAAAKTVIRPFSGDGR